MQAQAEVPDARTLVDYAKSLDCIHCGLCLNACPTYKLTGVETSSPRGRIHLMRAVAEGRMEPDAEFAGEMDFCLLCRGCESVCPAGVRFGAMMEYTRGELEREGRRPLAARLARWLGFRVVLPSRAALRLAAAGLRLVQRTGLVRAATALLGRLGFELGEAPSVPPASERRRLPEVTPAAGRKRAVVAVLEGCVMPHLFGRVNRATVESLAALGVESRVPRRQVCCGSLHAHNGDREGARRLARANVEVFEHATGGHGRAGQPLPLVVNSAGCASHLRELHHLFEPGDPWRTRAEALARRVRDYGEYVAGLLRDDGPELRLSEGAVRNPVAWDDPCHLCHGQGIREEPRRVMDALAGLERVELEDSESCCGSAGIYSLTRPADAAGVLAPKLDAFERTGARTLVTANPGCHMQWQQGLHRRGTDADVVHLAELVARATRDA